MLVKAIGSSLRTALFSARQLGQIRLLSAAGKADPNPGLAETKHGRNETDEDFDNRYLTFFNKPDLDAWELRKGMNDLHGLDSFADPKVISAALEAARRLNDHSICVRFMEALRWKGQVHRDIYPYIIQEIRPTLDKLGISTPEELGYDKPELALPDPWY